MPTNSETSLPGACQFSRAREVIRDALGFCTETATTAKVSLS